MLTIGHGKHRGPSAQLWADLRKFAGLTRTFDARGTLTRHRQSEWREVIGQRAVVMFCPKDDHIGSVLYERYMEKVERHLDPAMLAVPEDSTRIDWAVFRDLFIASAHLVSETTYDMGAGSGLYLNGEAALFVSAAGTRIVHAEVPIPALHERLQGEWLCVPPTAVYGFGRMLYLDEYAVEKYGGTINQTTPYEPVVSASFDINGHFVLAGRTLSHDFRIEVAPTPHFPFAPDLLMAVYAPLESTITLSDEVRRTVVERVGRQTVVVLSPAMRQRRPVLHIASVLFPYPTDSDTDTSGPDSEWPEIMVKGIDSHNADGRAVICDGSAAKYLGALSGVVTVGFPAPAKTHGALHLTWATGVTVVVNFPKAEVIP